MHYQLPVAMAVLAGGLSSIVTGAVVEIHVGGYYFLPQFADVQPGDTVRWIHDGGTHDVTSGANCSDDSGLFYSPISTAVPTFDWIVPSDVGSVIPYYCSVGNHCVSGDQFGALLVNVDAHYLSTNGLVFEPDHVDVNAGDAIFWLHGGGTHTVTSGADCIADGIFNSPLDNFNPMPFYVVPWNASPGVLDYYCIPHCGFGMTGTIGVFGNDPVGACCFLDILCNDNMTEADCLSNVDPDYTWYEGLSCVETYCGVDGSCCVPATGGGLECISVTQQNCIVIGGDWMGWMDCDEVSCEACDEDLNGDGTIGVDDLLLILASYGDACSGCPPDLNGNGIVDVDDLLQMLAAYGTDC
ncbi:MAG: hypothetical protein HOO04_00440 [Phycisphaerae bacterium]|nr:hypothetical protein [Phycisphaerae bacterium]